MFSRFIVATGLAIFLFGGCTAYRPPLEYPEPRPLGRDYKTATAAKIPSEADTAVSRGVSRVEELSLQQALSLALLRNPGLSAYSWEIRAREALALQASLWPNPEIGLEVENLGGTGDYGGLNRTETTLQVNQLIELAGKRSKRTRVATLESNLAAWGYEAKRLDVFAEVVKAFTEVVAAQTRVEVNKELLALAEKFVQTIERRVKAGKVSLAEASRAKVELSVATVELERSRRILLAARQRLAATWGSSEPEFKRVVGVLDVPSSIPSFEKMESFIYENPEIALWVAEMERRRAMLELEKARRIPDPTIIGGYRRLNETTDNAFILGLSIPIPIFNRNQGAVLEAEYRLKQTRSQSRAMETMMRSRLAGQYQMLSVLYNEARTLKENIIPDARNAFEIINKGYLLGKFTALDVLDAQRTLFEVRGRYLQALTDFHKTAADIERIIGRRLTDVK